MSCADLLPSLSDVLSAREERATWREQLAGGGTVLAATLRLPHALRLAHPDLLSEAAARIEATGFRSAGEALGADGRALFFLTDETPGQAKEKTIGLEDSLSIGRFLDLDVNGTQGAISRADLGRAPRTCVVCGAPVWECIRGGRHTEDEVAAVLEAVRFPAPKTTADGISRAAQIAAEEELRLLVKPGLVTPLTNGCHTDLNFPLMLESLAVLAPWWRHCAEAGVNAEAATPRLLASLRLAGLEAEIAMMEVTQGANAYRGLIYLLGILCAAAGWAQARGKSLLAVFDVAAALAADELCRTPDTITKAKARGLPMAGARGEASMGFPSVLQALRFLVREKERAARRADALSNTLLFLMSGTEDTNVAGRGGPEGLAWLQRAADAALQCGGLRTHDGTERYRALIAEAKQRNLSPGGSADLLIATLFLERLAPLFGENIA